MLPKDLVLRATCDGLVRKCGERDGFAHGLVTGWRRVQVIAAIEGGQQSIRMIGIANHCVEIDYAVEMAGGAYPLVHGLAIGFAQRARMIIVRADVRRDGSAEHAEAVRVSTIDKLPICRENTFNECCVSSRRNLAISRKSAKIVHTLENDQPSDTCWRQHVAIEARQSVGTEAIGQQLVSTDALIGDAYVSGMSRTLESRCKHIRPTVVAIRCASVSVGDGVAQHDETAAARGAACTSIPEISNQ